MYCWTFCLQSKWMLKVNYLYLTCLLFKKNNLLLKQFFAIKEKLIEDEFNFSQAQKAQKKWIQFFLQGHNAHNTRIPLFFAWLNKLHNIQSNFLQTEKDAKIVFVFMKNEFIIWGASALRLSGPIGPAPHTMNPFLMKKI